MSSRSRVGTGGRAVLAATIGSMAAAIAMVAGTGTASAAPVGTVDAGVPFSSVVYGTGCRYNLTVQVDASGPVTFWERAQGHPERFLGAAQADGAIATIRWVPQRIGDRLLYAKQNGVTGPTVVMRVHQGYGSGWACFAL
ncbi:hypothetical protein AAFP35_02200 [Gordonia sp. CPCC 206044]|uniref:hypothetical protein n=1 Tax=Gordonia sp. CPCC 206044 TaxID=3140793 RepID=UPI003AF34B7F